VFGLMLVEGDGDSTPTEVPRRWQECVAQAKVDPVLRESLPHRPAEQRQQIADAFIGVATWQKVCEEFSIDENSLPDLCG
jgi:hypothetical protein